jgi:hypothetical protein
VTVPFESSAMSTGSPESLWAQKRPGDRLLAAIPLPSGSSGILTNAPAT